jgi:hypothetical protein
MTLELLKERDHVDRDLGVAGVSADLLQARTVRGVDKLRVVAARVIDA